MSNDLTKSKDDIVLGGVCGGIAEYIGINSTVLRLLFLLFFNYTLVLYFILVFIMPEAED